MIGDDVNPTERHWFWDQPRPLHWLLVDESSMGEPDTAVAVCADIAGLFLDPTSASEPDQPVTLLGCRPEPRLSRALEALARGAGNPGGARHRRVINTSILSVADDGTATRVINAHLQGSVTGARPSVRGDGLVDVTLDTAFEDPMPAEARQIWDLWRIGRPTVRGQWARYDRELRHQWSGAALAHHHRQNPSDRLPGSIFHLDGHNVTDPEGFYCAIGEAINGPGGYFGWNADALHDCMSGRWGARRPFTLVWHDSAVARKYLMASEGPRTEAYGTTFDQLLQWFTEDGIEIRLQ